MDETTPERFLAPYPDPIREAAERLRSLVKQAVPDVIERVRPGWRLIGYELPLGHRSRYFAYVAPETEHVHLGFEHGASMDDPDGLLEGAHLRLKQVRYLTFRPTDPIPQPAILELTREAARVAAMSREERAALAIDRSWRPPSRETGDPGTS